MKKTKIDARRAFTLVELLVAVSIVTLLSSIVISAAMNAKQQASLASASSDLKLISGAVEVYLATHGELPPSSSGWLWATSAPGDGWDTLGTALQPLLSTIPYPTFPTVGNHLGLSKGYYFFKGNNIYDGLVATFNDSTTGLFAGCAIIRNNGIMLDMRMPQQSSATRNDGGVDPRGIEYYAGNYSLVYNLADCHYP